MASSNSTTPMTQFSSRGLRNARVKKTRHRCTTIAATSTSVAQWWVWRMSKPARTLNDSRMVESNAAETRAPLSGA
jgi:hypothetical protein